MKKEAQILEVWEAVRAELRVLRGRNRFRGNEEHLLHRREVRLHRESRGGQMHEEGFVLHLMPRLEDLWATRMPEGTELRVSDVGGDWKDWLGLIVDECRGGAYLKTNSSTADYRKAAAITEAVQQPN